MVSEFITEEVDAVGKDSTEDTTTENLVVENKELVSIHLERGAVGES